MRKSIGNVDRRGQPHAWLPGAPELPAAGVPPPPATGCMHTVSPSSQLHACMHAHLVVKSVWQGGVEALVEGVVAAHAALLCRRLSSLRGGNVVLRGMLLLSGAGRLFSNAAWGGAADRHTRARGCCCGRALHLRHKLSLQRPPTHPHIHTSTHPDTHTHTNPPHTHKCTLPKSTHAPSGSPLVRTRGPAAAARL